MVVTGSEQKEISSRYFHAATSAAVIRHVVHRNFWQLRLYAIDAMGVLSNAIYDYPGNVTVQEAPD